jgi:hypothetical protein
MLQEQTPCPEWLETARNAPASVFAGPEAVTVDTRLTLEQKLDILRSWEYDAAEIAVAVEEGMRGPEDDLLRRILLAIAGLTPSEEIGRVGASKQHGLS